jgi:hypothetical protein
MRRPSFLRLNAALEERIRWEALTAPRSELRAVVLANIPRAALAKTRPVKMWVGALIAGVLVGVATGSLVNALAPLVLAWLFSARWDASGYAVARSEAGVTMCTGHPNTPEVEIPWSDMQACGSVDSFGVRWVLVRTKTEHCFGSMFVLGRERL